jgi:glycine dehydrogenase subunit 1
VQVIEGLAQRGILGGVPASRLDPSRPELAGLIIVAATEVNTPGDIDAYAGALKEVLR